MHFLPAEGEFKGVVIAGIYNNNIGEGEFNIIILEIF